MALSVKDLLKLEKLLKALFEDRLLKLEVGQKHIHKDIRELKDGQVQIRKELDTEHELRYRKIERNSKDITMIKHHLNLTK